MNSRGFSRRLGRLEAATPQARPRAPVVFVAQYVERALEPGEHIALDWIRNSAGIVWARERISEDPLDQGRRCEPGTYIKDALDEVHRRCEYRGLPGGCALCRKTPLAAAAQTIVNEERENPDNQ